MKTVKDWKHPNQLTLFNALIVQKQNCTWANSDPIATEECVRDVMKQSTMRDIMAILFHQKPLETLINGPWIKNVFLYLLEEN